MFLERNPQSTLGGQEVIEQRKISFFHLQQAEPKSPTLRLTYMWLQSTDEFLHFGNGQSESSRTIYRNF